MGSDSDSVAVESMNTSAVVGLVGSVLVGVVGLFLLPVLQSLLGLEFGPAFSIVLAVELVAVVGVTVFIFRLHRENTFE